MPRFQPLHGRNKDEEFCLLGHAQPECSNSFSVLDLSFALPVSSFLKIKIKFGYIILRNSQTAVFGPPGSRSVCERYRSGSGFGSGFRIKVLLSSRKKIKKNLDFYSFFSFFYDILALKNDVNVVMVLQKKHKSLFFWHLEGH
jgi:hypothetical protein